MHWTILLNGSTFGSTSAGIVVPLSNGSYAFVVGGVQGFSPTPPSDSILVNGSNVAVSVVFSADSGGGGTGTSALGGSWLEPVLVTLGVGILLVMAVAAFLQWRRSKQPSPPPPAGVRISGRP